MVMLASLVIASNAWPAEFRTTLWIENMTDDCSGKVKISAFLLRKGFISFIEQQFQGKNFGEIMVGLTCRVLQG